MSKTYPCPQCGNVAEWHNNQWRPFCSEHCKLVDLDKWDKGDYAIGTEHGPEDIDDSQ